MTQAKRRRRKSWYSGHVSDTYVKQAQKDGYRSRAVYKLIELDRRDRLFRPGMIVVDLGAAPGGWAQYAQSRVGPKGRVIAVDILDMAPVPDVEFLQGDITDPALLAEIRGRMGPQGADLVISDMAPNISGIGAVDEARIEALAEIAAEFAQTALRRGGRLLLKTFQGAGFKQVRAGLERAFDQVAVRKPAASRSKSKEVYLLATGPRARDRARTADATLS